MYSYQRAGAEVFYVQYCTIVFLISHYRYHKYINNKVKTATHNTDNNDFHCCSEVGKSTGTSTSTCPSSLVASGLVTSYVENYI